MVILLAFLIGFIASRLGSDAFISVHFELEMVIFGSSVASVVVFMRLVPKWRDRNLALPLLLNGFVVGLFILALLLYTYHVLA